MSCLLVRKKRIAECYKLKPYTVSNIIKREQKKRLSTAVVKENGPEGRTVQKESMYV